MEVVEKPGWRQAGEERRRRENFLQRQQRARRQGLSEEDLREKERQLEEKRRQDADKKSRHDQEMDARVALWLQRERIVAYLPRLHEQREEALRRLADLDQLIADEEAAVAQIEAQVA